MQDAGLHQRKRKRVLILFFLFSFFFFVGNYILDRRLWLGVPCVASKAEKAESLNRREDGDPLGCMEYCGGLRHIGNEGL